MVLFRVKGKAAFSSKQLAVFHEITAAETNLSEILFVFFFKEKSLSEKVHKLLRRRCVKLRENAGLS